MELAETIALQAVAQDAQEIALILAQLVAQVLALDNVTGKSVRQ